MGTGKVSEARLIWSRIQLDDTLRHGIAQGLHSGSHGADRLFRPGPLSRCASATGTDSSLQQPSLTG